MVCVRGQNSSSSSSSLACYTIVPTATAVVAEHLTLGGVEVWRDENGQKYVLGSDRETDVGLIRIQNPPKELPVARLGSSRRAASRGSDGSLMWGPSVRPFVVSRPGWSSCRRAARARG